MMLFILMTDGYVSLLELPKLSQSPVLFTTVHNMLFTKSFVDADTFDIYDDSLHSTKNIRPGFHMALYGLGEKNLHPEVFRIADFRVREFKEFKERKQAVFPVVYSIYPTSMILTSMIPTSMIPISIIEEESNIQLVSSISTDTINTTKP